MSDEIEKALSLVEQGLPTADDLPQDPVQVGLERIENCLGAVLEILDPDGDLHDMRGDLELAIDELPVELPIRNKLYSDWRIVDDRLDKAIAGFGRLLTQVEKLQREGQ